MTELHCGSLEMTNTPSLKTFYGMFEAIDSCTDEHDPTWEIVTCETIAPRMKNFEMINKVVIKVKKSDDFSGGFLQGRSYIFVGYFKSYLIVSREMYITLMNGNYTIMKTKILEKWSRVGDGANPQHLTRMWRNLKGEKNVSPKEHVASQHMLLSYIANHAMINFYPISVKMSFIEEIDKYESSFSRTMLVQVIEVVETGGGLHYLRVWDGTLRDPNIKFVEPPPDWINDAKYFHVVDEDLKRETEKHSFFILCYKFREYFGQIRRSPGDFIVIKGLHFRKSNFYGIQQQEILVTESLFNDGKRAVVSNAGHSDIGLEIIKRHFNTIRAAINNKNNFFSYFEKSGNQYHLDQRVETQRRNQTQTESLHTLEEMGATTIISQSQRIQIMGRMYQATPQQLLTTMIEDPSDSEVTEVQPNSQSMAGQDTMILD